MNSPADVEVLYLSDAVIRVTVNGPGSLDLRLIRIALLASFALPIVPE